MGATDPLSFGLDDQDEHEEVLLDDASPLDAAATAPAPSRGDDDPLSSLSSAAQAPAGSYRDVYHTQQQHQPLQEQPASPKTQQVAGVSRGGADAAGSSVAGAPHHRAQASLTLENLEISADDSGFLRGGGGAGPSSRPAPVLQISVSDPVRRVGDSVIPGFTSTHTEYLVSASWDSPWRRVEVRRRFRDFVALADLLAVTQRGFFVFPRPDKNTLDQQLGKSDFVEVRRLELERYLRKLAAHPVVGQGEELRVFLEAEGSLGSSFQWQQLQPARGTLIEGISRLPRQLIGTDSSVPTTVEAQQNARNTSDLLRRFREIGERMRQEYKAPPVLQEQEVKLREKRAGVEEYAEKLAAASRRAELMVKEFEEMGAVMGDLGLSLVKLGRYEDEEGSKCGQYSDLGVGARAVATDAKRVGTAAVRQSRLARLANGQVMEALEPLHDELAMSPAVTAALRERETALLTLQSIEEDLERRRGAVVALEESGARRVGGDAAKARKVAAMQNDVSALEAALSAAQLEYERVKARNLQELERVRLERASEFARLARGFAEVDAMYGQRCQEIWRNVAADFGASSGPSRERCHRESEGGRYLRFAPRSHGRLLAQDAPDTESHPWHTNGRATWYEHPYTGSCGYGRLDPYEFGVDAVAAMPDASPQFPGSADGSVNLDRSNACYDTVSRIVVKVVDTCPCVGNEKWCCGDSGLQHFDLAAGAFARLAPQGQVKGAGTDVFVDGNIGLGWTKTIYGDDLQAMYSYAPSLTTFPDGDVALCTTVAQYGGFDFHTDDPDCTVFDGAQAVEFWVRSAGGIPDGIIFRLGDIMKGGCAKEFDLKSHATQDVEDGWARLLFPTADFECNQAVLLSDVNRLQFENRSPGKRFPEIVQECAQQAGDVQDSEGGGCDILHVDLNHILHACTHPSWREEAHMEEEAFLEVDLYLDRLVAISRPTQLVLVAMDGVAPSAKMAQQRGRRFYSAHLECQRRGIERQVRREMAAEMGPAGGAVDIPELPRDFDPNTITPGTAFMARISAHLDLFFRQKLECDPTWQHLLVVFSDSSEPGEGEHKILRFIRQQRTRSDYNPNTRHCIFGQDADLILLGLLSHEPHFSILRESGVLDLAQLRQAEEGAGEEGGGGTAAAWSPVGQQPLELLRLSTLRDFLRCEFAEFCSEQPAAAGAQAGSPASNPGSPTCAGSSLEGGEIDLITGQPKKVHPKAARQRQRRQHNDMQGGDGFGGGGSADAFGGPEAVGGGGGFCFERIIDDVVFVTFLAGNDFLPHIPSLDIYDRPSALQTCLDAYKELLAGGGGQPGGYLTNGGRVDVGRLCTLFAKLGALEVATFEQREQRKVREQRRKMQQDAATAGRGGQSAPVSASWMGGGDWVSVGGLAPGERLEDALAGKELGFNSDLPSTAQAALWASDGVALRRELLQRVKARMDDRAQAGMAADPVRLSMPGYRARYYRKCFGAEEEKGPGLERLVRSVCADYCRTLCWVLAYYSRGSPPVPTGGCGAEAAGAGASSGRSAAGKHSSKGAARDRGSVPYASWRVHYRHHYAPLASDLAKYGREALKGATAAACPTDTPIQPFAQLLSVLPFSSMPACLPQLVASRAADVDEGLLALHGGEAGAGPGLFPADVSALVDLSGKKWSHTAVIRLPFPDVAAIEGFVEDLLASEEAEGSSDSGSAAASDPETGCLTAEERSRNVPKPARLLMNVMHPLAQGDRRCGIADAVTGGSGSSILSLLQQPEAWPACGDVASGDHAVLSLALDLAGQDTPPFSPGLLPGTDEGERSVTLQSWNRRKLAEQRRQADRALAGLRGRGGAGRSSGRGGRGGRAVPAQSGSRGGRGYAALPPANLQTTAGKAAPAPVQGWQYEELGQVWTPPEVPTSHALHPRSLQPVGTSSIDTGWSVPKPRALGSRRAAGGSSGAAHLAVPAPTGFNCSATPARDAWQIEELGLHPADTDSQVEEVADVMPWLHTPAQLSEEPPVARSAGDATGWDDVPAATAPAVAEGSSDGDELDEMLALLGIA
ncbi:5'-3' exoribonuclease 2 [Chlorella vulgaris]